MASTKASIDKELIEELLEVGNKLLDPPSSVDNLLHLLCQIRKCLSRVEQAPTPYIKAALSPSLKALIADKLIKHSNVDVKVALASCFNEITRIAAPEMPYNDPQMKEVLRLIVSSFGNLHGKSSPWYAERILILDSVAKVRLGVVMLDLECDALILEMFQIFFKTIREHNAETVFSSMKTIMVHVLEESENISLDLLSPILDCLNKKNEVVLPIARKLGESVLQSCATKVKPYLRQAVNKLGTSLDDYSDVLASICIVLPEASETVRSSKKRNSSSKGSGSSKKKTHTSSGYEIKGASKSSSDSDSPRIKKRKPSKVGLTAAKKVSAQQLPIISEETGDKEAGLTAAKDQSLPLIKRLRTSKTTTSKVPPSSSTRAASAVSAAFATKAPQAECNSETLPNVIISKISQFQPSTPLAKTISTQSPPSSQRITNDKPELEDPSTPCPPPNFETLVRSSDPSITIATASELPSPQITTIGFDRIALTTKPEPYTTTTIDLTNSESFPIPSPNISLNLSPPSTYPEIEDFSKIIFGQVKELLDERSMITNPMESDLMWDNIRKQVDEFLVSLKESSRQQALANQEALKEWYHSRVLGTGELNKTSALPAEVTGELTTEKMSELAIPPCKSYTNFDKGGMEESSAVKENATTHMSEENVVTEATNPDLVYDVKTSTKWASDSNVLLTEDTQTIYTSSRRKPHRAKPKQGPLTKRKYVRRSKLNKFSTPTEASGDLPEKLMPESAKTSCMKSLNFDGGARDESSADRENASVHPCKETGAAMQEIDVCLDYDMETFMKQAAESSADRENASVHPCKETGAAMQEIDVCLDYDMETFMKQAAEYNYMSFCNNEKTTSTPPSKTNPPGKKPKENLTGNKYKRRKRLNKSPTCQTKMTEQTGAMMPESKETPMRRFSDFDMGAKDESSAHKEIVNVQMADVVEETPVGLAHNQDLWIKHALNSYMPLPEDPEENPNGKRKCVRKKRWKRTLE